MKQVLGHLSHTENEMKIMSLHEITKYQTKWYLLKDIQ